MDSHQKKRTSKMTDQWHNTHFAFYAVFLLHFIALLFLEVFPLNAEESCDRQRKVFTSSYGIISSGDKEYSMDSHCEWLIKANGSKQFISLSFVKMDTECSYDHVYVYDGDSYASPLLGSFSGNATPSTVTARNGAMLILLYSDTNYVRSGFEATFSITDCPLNCSGKGFCLSHHCVCNSQQTGEACDIDLCPMNCGQSEGKGECIGEHVNQKCKCKAGYSGFDCSLPDSNKNGGSIWHTVSPDSFSDKQRASHSGIYIEELDTFYLYGGYTFGQVHGDLIAYDFGINEWVNLTVPDGPSPRRNHASASLGNNFVIFGGELEDGKLSDEFWMFNTSSHQWTQLFSNSTTWPPPVAKHTLTLVQDNWIYLYGGILPNSSFSSCMYRTRLDVHISWEKIITFGGEKNNRQIVGHSAVYYQPMDSIFIYGGVIVEFSHVSKLNHNIYAFHVRKKSWTKLNFPKDRNMPLERAFHTAAVIGEYMVVHGGYTHRHIQEEICYDNRTYLYHLKCHKWIDVDNLTKDFSDAYSYMNQGIFSHVMAVRHGHTLLIHGGYSGVMHSALYAYVLPPLIAGRHLLSNPCDSHKSSVSCKSNLACVWCSDQNLCIERKMKKMCSNYISDSCPGLCPTLTNCQSCLIWGDPSLMNTINDDGLQDNFPSASCSWLVKDMLCLPVMGANIFHTANLENNMVATSSPVTWWGPNQTVVSALNNCTCEDFPPGLLSIKYRHPVNWSQPDGVSLLNRALEDFYLRSEISQNDSSEGDMNVVRFLAFLHPFYAKPLSERLSGLKLFMCSGGQSFATLKLSNDTFVSHSEVVASHATKSSYMCSAVERPNGRPLFPDSSKGYKYLLDFTVNVSTAVNDTTRIQLGWNSFSVQLDAINYQYLEPYRNGSCSKHKNCLSCLTDNDCAWCETDTSCYAKHNASEVICKLNGEPHLLITQPSECFTCSDLVYCSHCSQVSLCEWLVDAAFCVRRGRFKKAVQDPRLCPTPCHMRTNCTSCLADPGICAWCEATQTCFLFSTYTTSYMFGLCRDWVDEHRYEPNGNPVALCHDCSKYKDCKQCLQHLNCGWCSYTENPVLGVCMHGDFGEPSEQSCLSRLQEEHNSSKAVGLPQWSYGTCPDVEECLLGLHDCHPNATCTNTQESFECQCSVGFKGDGKACIRACAVQCVSGYCSEAPHYKCICQVGWTGEDCGVDCGCNNHSTCTMGPGNCDKCEKWTEGEFCERCSPGSYGSAVSTLGCRKCNCNGHGDAALGYCNATTGSCYCKDNTEGPNCTKCQPGYYGDPKNGGHCYEECQPRGVKTAFVSGRLGSSVKSSATADCLWLLTVYPLLNMESLLLPMPKANAAIELIIEETMKIPCPHNHIYVYDGLPDFIAAGHPSVLLGAFCGINLSQPISVVATSGYLTIHFKHSGTEEGFNANYRILENFIEENRTCVSHNCENYSVNVNYNIEYCPNNCSESENLGVCDMAYGKCICENGHGDDDCSVKLKPYSLVWSSFYNHAELLERDVNTPSGRMGHSLFSLNSEADDIEDIWLFGGYSPRLGELNDMFIFETLTRQWIKLELVHAPPARHFHATATHKEFVYIFGGMTCKSLLDDFWEFNSHIESWRKLVTPEYVKPMAGSTLTATENGNLYLIGGLSAQFGFFDKVAMYNLKTNLWQFINCTGAQPIGIFGHSSVYHHDTNSIYVFGGVSYEENSVEISGKLYAFKLSSKQWFRLPPDVHVNPVKTQPQRRYFHTAVVTKHYMIVIGGRGSLSDKHSPSSYGYVFSCNAWISLSDEDIDIVGKPPNSIISGSATIANGDIYIFSGYDGDLKQLSLPVDLCALFSSSRVRCILHVGCAFCSVFENGVNQTFCYSQILNTPSGCYNPKVASEVVPAASCNAGWIEKRDCGQYGSCSDCVTEWPAFSEAKQVCQWCSNCKVGKCIPVGTSCENENDCNIPLKVISESSVCPTRMCWASDCEKCLQIGDCIWTRQVQRSGGFGHNLNRKPIYNWICVMKEIQDAPPFPIKSMPPLTCPSPCITYKNCSSCLKSAGGEGGWHQCIWSEITKTCMMPSFELMRCEDGSCGPVIQGNATQCPVPCWHYEQAAHCLSHANCGWCAFTGTPVDGWGLCIEGGIMGPTGGLCKENHVLLLGAPLPVQVERKFASSQGPPKWTYLTKPPENECLNGHHTCDEGHQVCVDTPTSFECQCKPGYELKSDQSNECKPICRQGCVNGTCVQPDVCKCNFGYVGKNCSLACKCNGHSDCPGPDELTVCPNCQNNTQGLYCQTCKPFFVGNPQNGGSCIPCQVYCYGHSSMCLNSELLSTNSSIVTQPYNKTHLRLSLINNAEMMRQLFENQLMQTILNNPEYMRQMILNNKEAKQYIDKNPDVKRILNDAELFRQTVEVIRNPAMLQEALKAQDKPIANFEMSELLEKITEGSWSDAVCIDCQNNTQGKRCDQCVPGFFKAGDTLEDGCRPCECHGHGDTCNPYTGEGCNCQNNTENDRQCTQKNAKNIITPCWQLQCSKCKEYFLGAPAHGHQCYRHMFLDKDYCFDPNTHDECNRKPSSLLQGRTVFFAVQPRYMNVDIRIVVDVTEGGVDFFFSAKEDTFVVEVNKTTGVHHISIDRKYGIDLRNDFEFIYHGNLEISKKSKRAAIIDDSFQEVFNFTESPSSSSLFIRDVDSNDLTTYVTVRKSQEFMLIRNLQNRLIITIPQQIHDLRSTRFYMVLRGVGNEKVSVTYGNLFFRQDQTRIDLFVFFSVFFSCFFLFLAICVVIWKVKQAFDVRRARRLHAAEMKHMASRPFGHVITVVEDEPDDYDFLFYSPTNYRKKLKHNKVYGRDSPKAGEERFCLRPIAVEPLSNGTAAVATILVQLPGGAHSLVKMTLASALITSRSSHYHVGYGIRAVMRRRTSHANV